MRSEEQKALAEMLGDFATANTDLEKSRAGKPATSLASVEALGLLDMLRDEDGTLVDVGVVSEEMGRAAFGVPVAETIVGNGIASAAFQADGNWLPVILNPATNSAVLHSPDVDGYVLVDPQTGTGRMLARSDYSTKTRTVLDLTRDYVSIESSAAPGTVPEVAIDVDQVINQLDVIRSLDAVGAADRLLSLTLEHALSRQQFGVLIGSFQAVKHHCATMRSDLVSARAAAEHAAEDVAANDPNASRIAASAALHAIGAAGAIASLALQIHGGMGFTWEHDLHLYMRRIKANEMLQGGPAQMRSRLAHHL